MDRQDVRTPLFVLALLIGSAVTLRYAQEFFLPLVFAGLLSFLLSPLVRRLERWGLGRAGAVLTTATLVFLLLGGLAYLVSSQFLDLADSLPKYRTNLIARVSALKTRENSPLGRGVKIISEVTEAMNQPEGAVGKDPAAGSAGARFRPLQVEVVSADSSAVRTLIGVLGPIFNPMASALVVMVIVAFMLMAGEDLRDRLIHLVGRGRLRVTTQALDEVALRIGRYLLAQLIVNASFGLVVAVGLSVIGIANPVVWGLLAMGLRFLPYIGPCLAALFPFGLSLAMFPGWREPLSTLALFAVAELVISNVVEPWLYGASTEISPLAVVVSALFWTWLWGGVGLVLATPLTVCLAVAGKYLPDLAFVDLLIGDKPSIAPGDRLYQRLLAVNKEEAAAIVEREVESSSAVAAFDEVVLPALRFVEEDFRAGVLAESARAEAFEILREIITGLAGPLGQPGERKAAVLCLPANHEGDELGAIMLAQGLGAAGIEATVLSSRLLSGELVEQATALCPAIICISSMPPISAIGARALVQRLRARLPAARILVGLWQVDEMEFPARRGRLGEAGADETYADLRHACAGVLEIAACSLPVSTPTP